MRSGNTEPETIDAFLTRVLTNIDRYWTTTFATADLPEPQVGFEAVPPRAFRPTACDTIADDRAAFYCPTDDTIYVAQQFASDLYRGVVRGLPGEQAGFGRATGDFAVAYVLAHEYAHNLQQELGTFDNGIGSSAKPFELQADCLAGTWAHSVFEQGLLEPGDLEEATNAALAVGDFDVGNAIHHGTPEERATRCSPAMRTASRRTATSSCRPDRPGRARRRSRDRRQVAPRDPVDAVARARGVAVGVDRVATHDRVAIARVRTALRSRRCVGPPRSIESSASAIAS